jgi:ribonuclease HI
MAKKYYAVKNGRKVGIFNSWDTCKNYVIGYKGAEYKGFNTIDEAKDYLANKEIKINEAETKTIDHDGIKEYEVYIYVDGSYEEALDLYSYGAVCLISNDEDDLSFKKLSGVGNQYKSMRNVAGELAGVIQGLKWAVNHHYKKAKIFHDYSGIAKWAEGHWKANEVGVKRYKELMAMLQEEITVEFVKVKAHSGIKYNEMADQLAGDELQKIKKLWKLK